MDFIDRLEERIRLQRLICIAHENEARRKWSWGVLAASVVLNGLPKSWPTLAAFYVNLRSEFTYTSFDFHKMTSIYDRKTIDIFQLEFLVMM